MTVDVYMNQLQAFAEINSLVLFDSVKEFIKNNYENKFENQKYHINLFNPWTSYICTSAYLASINSISFYSICNKLYTSTNEKSFPVLEIATHTYFRNYIFISESGKFYLDDMTYLGDNCNNMLEKFSALNIEISISASNRLLECWDRYMNHLQAYVKKNNLIFFDSAKKFITKNFFNQLKNKKYVIDLLVVSSLMYNRQKIYLNGKEFSTICQELYATSNENIFPVIEIHTYTYLRRYILISESGKFYLDDKTYLGDNYSQIIENILCGNIDIPIMTCDKIFISLERHGWQKNKKQDIIHIKEKYKQFNRKMFPKAIAFFEEIPIGKYKHWFSDKGYDEFQIRPINTFHQNRIPENHLCIGSGVESLFYIGESGKFYIEHYKLYQFSNVYEFLTWAFEYFY